MDSPAACDSSAMAIADKCNHSAAGTLHPNHTDGQTTTVCTALAKFEFGRHIYSIYL